ncbi:MAG: manganese efflux pump [Oscillibacter sp.]|nr:manganese efflux pump [Oscillibacter sp.]
MAWNVSFFLNSILLGVGLAMDAFSVSLANGLHEPRMRRRRMCAVAGVYGAFQALMPMSGWALVRTIAEQFRAFQRCIPWIGFALLVWIGGKMLLEAVRGETEEEMPALSAGILFVQGVATSIDALSVGFAIADYGPAAALASSLIIAAVTFCICMAGLALGRRFGTVLSRRSGLLGGVILIGIGVEILLRAVL